MFLFRPPYGARDARIDEDRARNGLLEILWTVDSADSLGANYARIEHNVIAGLHGGAIILMHENHGQTVRALIAIFAALQRKHLRAVSVPQLLADDPPSRAQVRAGGRSCGLAHGVHGGGVRRCPAAPERRAATRTASARRGSRTARPAPSPRTPPPRRRR